VVAVRFLISRHGNVFRIVAYSIREYVQLFGGGNESNHFLAVIEVYWSRDDFSNEVESGHELEPNAELLEEILGLGPDHYQIDDERKLVLLKDWPADTPLWVKQELETDFGPEETDS
jgi:hypothetical protein